MIFGIRSIAATSAAILALSAPIAAAEAKVIAYSSLQVTNFFVVSGAEALDIPSITVVNTTTSAASLNGVNDSSSAPVNGAPGNPVANSDVSMTCIGTCGGIAQNDYSSVSVANPGWQFARSDASLTGSIVTPGGINARTVAETQMHTAVTSSASSAIQSIGNFLTIEFTPGQSGDLSLTFDVLGELRAFSDDVDGIALVDFDFAISLLDITNGGMIDIGVSSLDGQLDFSRLNQSRSALGVQEQSYLVDDSFTLTMTGLLSDNNYRLQISQNTDISATDTTPTAVPEPGSLALLGLAVLGTGALSVRRRERVFPQPASSPR